MAGTPTLWSGPNRFYSHGQHALFYQAWIPSHPQRMVVGLHGAGQHSGWFEPLATRLIVHGLAVYALDLRGFGRSSGVRGHVDCFDQYLDDVDAVISRINQRHPGIPIILLGHSLGGIVAIRYAQERSAPIRALVVSAPALRPRMVIPPLVEAVILMMSRIAPMTSIDVTKWSAVLFRDLPRYDQNVVQTGHQGDPWNTTRFSVRWFHELLIHGQHALHQAHHLQLPVLSFCSTDDGLVDPWAVHQFYHALPGPNKKHVMLCQKPHDWILYPNETDPLYTDILRWMKTQ